MVLNSYIPRYVLLSQQVLQSCTFNDRVATAQPVDGGYR